MPLQERNADQFALFEGDFFSRENHIVLNDDRFFEADEMAAPANPAADRIRIFARDDGGGVSQL